MDKRPTIIDVARRAGVSKSTVSLVVRNSPSVKEETRKQVQKAMEETGYVYNRSAANLRGSDTGLIGLIINDLKNPFFTEFATSLQMALDDKGYATVLANTDEDPIKQEKVVAAMLEHGVSALILSSAYGVSVDQFDAIHRSGVPMIQVLRQLDERIDLFPLIVPNYFEGGAQATRHLLDEGARRIAFVGGIDGRDVTRDRMAGYLEALSERDVEPIVLEGRATRQFGRQSLLHLQKHHPECDAALCFNDLTALGVLTACAEAGLSVGRDMKVVGFDDIEEAGQCWPALSSVSCNIDSFGKTVAKTVLDWLENGFIPDPVTHTPTELIIRQSSTPACTAKAGKGMV